MCIALPLLTLVGVTNYGKINQKQQEYIESLNNKTNYSMDILTEKFFNIRNTVNSIFTSVWYKHYINNSGIYDSEFDILKRMEICDDLKFKIISMDFVSDILIITPKLDSVICKNGWFSTKDYDDFYGYINISTVIDSKYPIIKSNDDNYYTIVYYDTDYRIDRSVICILIDKMLFAKHFQQIHNYITLYINIEVDELPLYQYGNIVESDEYSFSAKSSIYPYLNMDVTYYDYNKVFFDESIYILKMQLVIVTLSAMLLAILLTIINTRPLKTLLQHFPRNKYRSTIDMYKYINDYVNNLSDLNSQLKCENDSLTESVTKYFAQKESMYSMLTDHKFDFNNEYILRHIPWINDNLPFIMILFDSKHPAYDTKSLYNYILSNEYYTHFISFELLDSEFCMIFWFDNISYAEKQRNRICLKLTETFDTEFFIECSDIINKPNKMPENFKLMKYEISVQKLLDFELPITLQVDFVTKIKNSAYEDCFQIIQKSKGKFKPEAFLLLLFSIAREYNIDVKDTLALCKKHLSNQDHRILWKIIMSFTSEIVTKISMDKSNNSADANKLICGYIDANYSNPNMSIKHLSSIFKLDGTLISKMFKKETGMTFTEYLLDLRINYAIKLLRDTDMSIAKISETVGYEHYLSFKRAFIRIKKMTPKEYREHMVTNRL